MAIVKAIKSGASIKRIINYVTRNNDLENLLMDGVDCNPSTASQEMLYTRDKFSKYDGVQYIHLVYSLSPSESENVEMSQIIANAKKLIAETDNFQNHQVIICGHDDKEHKHAHIVVNAVNFENGKKVRWYRTDLRAFKERLIQISKEQGLIVPEKGQGYSLGGNSERLYKSVERAYSQEYDSWMLNIYKKVLDSKEFAVNKEDFVMSLAEYHIQTRWDNRQTILFEDEYGHKVRNTRLGEVFKIDLSKEALLNEFTVTEQLFEAERGFEECAADEAESVSDTETRERCIELSAYDDDIKAAIDAIRIATTNEQNSATRRDDKIAERANREDERKRHNIEEQQRIAQKSDRIRIRKRRISRER
ncbi:MAG: relaxase/mobilization nuclease domain-containing protein [Phascolarctobacterium sp.]|nr:relaxase/mobilization nuclease domain-containing protein [Phascolarctobacterium sp.]